MDTEQLTKIAASLNVIKVLLALILIVLASWACFAWRMAHGMAWW